MKKLILLVIVVSLVFPTSCVIQKKSTMNQLKGRKNPIDAMRFPEKKTTAQPSAVPKKDETIEIISEGEKETTVSGERVKLGLPPEIDFSPLDRIPETPVTRRVVVSGDDVSMRQGPGDRFRELGKASQDSLYKLHRIQRGPDDNLPWYLVEDEGGNKFFISSEFSSIEEESAQAGKKAIARSEPQYKVGKELIRKSQKTDLEQIRNVIDPTPPIPEELKKAKHITLNFEGTELYDVITTFSELLQIDYIIEGNIEGKVTLQTFNKIQVEDLYDILEQILALHNITVVRSGHFYRFLPVKDAAKKPLSIHYGDDPNIPPNERMIIQIIPLKHISVESMKNIIGPLLTPNASFIEIPETNYLMMIEMAANIKRIVKVVEALDIDKLASSDVQLYKLNNADTELVVAELNEIFTSMGYTETLGESLTFLSLGRLNSILVVNAFENILPTIEFWINKLDQPISEGEVSTFVYYVQNGDASRMASLLNGIFESGSTETDKNGKKPTVTKASLTSKKTDAKTAADKTKQTRTSKIKVKGDIRETFEGELTIIPDADTNALII
ncbi:MAG: secretin N-terminal domain-containing protein, partial [Nitrospinaceae bacterium]